MNIYIESVVKIKTILIKLKEMKKERILVIFYMHSCPYEINVFLHSNMKNADSYIIANEIMPRFR